MDAMTSKALAAGGKAIERAKSRLDEQERMDEDLEAYSRDLLEKRMASRGAGSGLSGSEASQGTSDENIAALASCVDDDGFDLLQPAAQSQGIRVLNALREEGSVDDAQYASLSQAFTKMYQVAARSRGVVREKSIEMQVLMRRKAEESVDVAEFVAKVDNDGSEHVGGGVRSAEEVDTEGRPISYYQDELAKAQIHDSTIQAHLERLEQVKSQLETDRDLLLRRREQLEAERRDAMVPVERQTLEQIESLEVLKEQRGKELEHLYKGRLRLLEDQDGVKDHAETLVLEEGRLQTEVEVVEKMLQGSESMQPAAVSRLESIMSQVEILKREIDKTNDIISKADVKYKELENQKENEVYERNVREQEMKKKKDMETILLRDVATGREQVSSNHQTRTKIDMELDYGKRELRRAQEDLLRRVRERDLAFKKQQKAESQLTKTRQKIPRVHVQINELRREAEAIQYGAAKQRASLHALGTEVNVAIYTIVKREQGEESDRLVLEKLLKKNKDLEDEVAQLAEDERKLIREVAKCACDRERQSREAVSKNRKLREQLEKLKRQDLHIEDIMKNYADVRAEASRLQHLYEKGQE